MQYNTRQRPGRAREFLAWWNSPTDLHTSLGRRIWIAVTVAALILTTSVAVTSLWNYYGLSLPVPEPTSDVSTPKFQAPTSLAIRPTAAIRWEFDSVQPLSAPATAADGVIYVVSGTTADTGAITSIDTSEGSELWKVKLDSIADYAPTVAGDMVFLGTRAGNLIALDRNTGDTAWVSDLEFSVVGSPIVDAGVIYIASRAVHAIDAATGNEIWRHEAGGDISRPIRLSGQIVSAISSDGNVNLISAANGRRRLTFPLWFSTSAAPVLSGATLVVPGDRASVQALDTRQRDIPMEKAVRFWWTKLWLWDMAPRPPLPRAYLWQNRSMDGDTAYALAADDNSAFLGVSEVDGSGTLVALDLSTGETRWEAAAASTILAPAILTEDSLIVGIEAAGVLSVDKLTGAVRWEIPVEEGLSTAPTLSESGLLLVPTADGRLRAIR